MTKERTSCKNEHHKCSHSSRSLTHYRKSHLTFLDVVNGLVTTPLDFRSLRYPTTNSITLTAKKWHTGLSKAIEYICSTHSGSGLISASSLCSSDLLGSVANEFEVKPQNKFQVLNVNAAPEQEWMSRTSQITQVSRLLSIHLPSCCQLATRHWFGNFSREV